MTVRAALEPFRDAVASSHAAAKSAQGRCVGFSGRTISRELISAAGLTAVELRGQPGAATPLADRYMEDLFDPAVRSIFQQLLEGAYAGLSGVVLPRSEDSLHRLYYYLCELRRTGEVPALPQPILYDLLKTPWPSSAAYNLARTAELRDVLATLGKPLNDAALAAALAERQARDKALEKLATLRRTYHIATEAYALMRDAADTMSPQDFTEALLQLRSQLKKLRPLRVLVAGSVLDDPALHRMLEEEGVSVVADHSLRDMPVRKAADEALPPLEALSHYYHHAVPSARTYPSDPRALAEAARDSGATHCISYLYAHEEGLSWDYPAQAAALTRAGIPILALHDQPYLVPAGALRPRIRDFLRAGRA